METSKVMRFVILSVELFKPEPTSAHGKHSNVVPLRTGHLRQQCKMIAAAGLRTLDVDGDNAIVWYYFFHELRRDEGSEFFNSNTGVGHLLGHFQFFGRSAVNGHWSTGKKMKKRLLFMSCVLNSFVSFRRKAASPYQSIPFSPFQTGSSVYF